MLGELPGFIADMDAAGPWEPVPILLAMAEPNGPVEQAFFDRMMVEWEAGLRDAGHLDGVYCVLHGAGLTTADHDPEGTLLALVRRIVGADVPVVASYDLHANVSDAECRSGECLHWLPHQSASRHARTRRGVGADAAQLAGGHEARTWRACGFPLCRRLSACSRARMRTNGHMAN